MTPAPELLRAGVHDGVFVGWWTVVVEPARGREVARGARLSALPRCHLHGRVFVYVVALETWSLVRFCGRRLGGRAVILEGDPTGICPQPLEVVVVAFLLVEHVNDEIDVVEQDPAALALAFAAEGLAVPFGQPLLDFTRDCLDLPIGISAADHEVVGDDELLRDVEDHYALGFLGRGGRRSIEDEIEVPV